MKQLFNFLAVFSLLVAAGCSDDDAPAAENEEEVINEVILTFTPEGGSSVSFTYNDPDGEGTDAPTQDKIVLNDNTQYYMTVTLKNTVGDADENITEEVEEEGDEHMFFYGWTNGLFQAPSGDGNIDNSSDPVAYGDFDVNTLPIGLETAWKTGGPASGTFRMILKHQPDIKSEISTSGDGESDIDLEWDIEIQ